MENQERYVSKENREFKFPDNIEKLQGDLRNGFFEYFESKGYAKVEPEELVPKNDKSLIFTNSTIVPVKKYVEAKNIPDPGVVIEQPCLRFQNLKYLYNQEKPLSYASYFKMLGIMCPTERYSQMQEEIKDYLTLHLGFQKDSIKILMSSRDVNLFPGWADNDAIEIDTKSQSFYRWTYGMKQIYGRGLTLSIRQEDDQFKDLGNVVAICNISDEVIGYEFGFGIETAIARKHKLDSPLEAARISEVIEYKNDPLVQKYQDALSVACVLYRLGVRAGEGGGNYLAKKNIKALAALTKGLSLDRSVLQQHIENFEEAEFGTKTDISKAILEDLYKYNKSLS